MSDIGNETIARPARTRFFRRRVVFTDYIALLKPRVMSLVVFTALVGMVIAPGSMAHGDMVIALLCISLGAGASGALNMWYDADIDALMRRTAMRPIPRGRVRPLEALVLGLGLAAFSIISLGYAINWAAAALLAATIGFYMLVYTMWLKRLTPQNIVIGGASGAMPPLVGWAAATGSLDMAGVVLFLIIFLWTPPHFWALALYRAGDYQKAGVPMLPVVAGGDETRRQILIYSLLLVPVSFLPILFGVGGLLYVWVAAVMGMLFIWSALGVYRHRQGEKAIRAARKLFGFSIMYLFTLFAVLLAGAAQF